jgi:NAD(P)-dependent dehydrogenase (short-subunit alcohol dehydrogenase family)
MILLDTNVVSEAASRSSAALSNCRKPSGTASSRSTSKASFWRCVIPQMLKAGGGSIVNISSIASLRYTGVPYATYYASKAAMNHLTRTTAVEYAARNIRVNCVLPGLVKTPMVEHAADLAECYSGGDARGDVARA